MFNFQVSSFPDQNNLLDDITESSMESHLDDSRFGYKNVFHNPLRDDSQFKEGRSFRDPNENKLLTNVINNQPNSYYPETNTKKESSPQIKSPNYELKENKFLTGDHLYIPQNQNFGYSYNNPYSESQRATSQSNYEFQTLSKGQGPFSSNLQLTSNFNKEPSMNVYAERNQNLFLQDISAEPSLNESNVKPMMNNPYGQNQSFNRSNVDVSRSKLDNSGMRSNFVELGQKSREEQREYFNVNFNPSSIQGQDIHPRTINLEGNISNITEDTKDLSYLSINNFKSAFPQKDNSYMLNKSQANDMSGNKNLYSQIPQQNFGQKFDNPANKFPQKADASVYTTDSGPRFTGNFGVNPKVDYTNQPVDLLTLVSSGMDPRTQNVHMHTNQFNKQPAYPAQQQGPPARNFGFQENEKMSLMSHPSVTNYFNSVQTIPKQSTTDGRGTEVKELQGLLANLESLELSKISAVSDSFDDDEEDHRHKKSTKQDVLPTQLASKVAREEFLRENNIKSLSEQIMNPNIQNMNTYSSNPVPRPYNSTFTQSPQISNNPPDMFGNPYYGQNNQGFEMTSKYEGYNQGYSAPNSSRPIYSQIKETNMMSQNLYLPPASGSPTPRFDQLPMRQSIPLKEHYITRDSTKQYVQSELPMRQAPNYSEVSPQIQNNFSYQDQNQPMYNLNPLRNSVTLSSSRNYHNPFSNEVASPSKRPLNEPRNLEATPIANMNLYASMPPQRNTKGLYSDEPSSPSKVVEEADDIVNKMQNLYQDWKNKNAELNQYMNELSQTSSQNMGERSTYTKFENMQHNSLNSVPVEQRPRQTMQNFSNHANFYLNDKYTSPYEFRYSMQNPKSYDCFQPEASQVYQENLKAFMREDLLQGIEQPDPKKIGQVKQKFKTFSNPIFKNQPTTTDSAQETTDENPLSKRDYQRDSLKMINKIFDTTKTDKERLVLSSAKDHVNLVLGLSNQSTPKSSRDFREPGPNTAYRRENNSTQSTPKQKERYIDQTEFKPKFKKQDRSRMHDVSIRHDQDLDLSTQGKGNNARAHNKKYSTISDQHTVFGIPVKKEKLIEGVDQRKIDVDNMEIICINCQEFIKMSEVDRHSRFCDKIVNESHRDIEIHNSETIQELNAKLSSIRSRLNSKLQGLRAKGGLDTKIKETIKITDRIIAENYDLENLIFEIHNLERLMDDIAKSKLAEQEFSVLIYINRISIIAKEKYSEIQLADLDEAEIEQLENRIYEYEKETKKQKAELELWKYQAHMMKEIKLSDEKNLRYVKAQYKKDNEVLSQIQSDIDYSERGSSHGGTSVTSGALPFLPDLGVGRSPSENAKSETKKIKFYSMAVNNKLLLPSSHPGKDVLISDLYDDCLSQKVPEDKWEDFIKVKLGLRQ